MNPTTQRHFSDVQARIQAARDRGDLPVAPVDGLPVSTGPAPCYRCSGSGADPAPTPVPQEPAEALPGLFDLWMVQREQQAAIVALQQQREAEVPYVAANLGHIALKAVLAASITVGVTVGLAGALLALLPWAS